MAQPASTPLGQYGSTPMGLDVTIRTPFCVTMPFPDAPGKTFTDLMTWVCDDEQLGYYRLTMGATITMRFSDPDVALGVKDRFG